MDGTRAITDKESYTSTLVNKHLGLVKSVEVIKK